MTVATLGALPIPASGSKPHAVDALRTTWRRSTQHFMEQIARFVRLTMLASVPVVTDAIVAATIKGQHFSWLTLLTLIVPVGETAYRQVFPALGAAAADQAPGVTIVPSQVGVPDAPGAPVATPAAPTSAPAAVPPPVADAPVDLNSIPADLP